MIFDPDQQFFEDEGFSNSKKYFWASQCLRVFADYVENANDVTSAMLKFLDYMPYSSSRDWNELKAEDCVQGLQKLQKRIERKQKEVQNLSNGVRSSQTLEEIVTN